MTASKTVPSIFEIAKNLASTHDVDSLLGQISNAVEQLTGSEAASILLLDSDKKRLVFRVATGEKGASVKRFYVEMGKGIAGWVAANGESVVINDVQSDTRFTGQIDKSSGFSTRSIMAVPMYAGKELIGVCEALNKKKGEYSKEDLGVMQNLSTLAATTINNTRISEEYRNFFTHMIEILCMAVESGDSKRTGHSFRVAELACRIGRQLGISGDEYKTLYYGALLHDLGMVAVHDLRFLPNVMKNTIERTPEKLHPLVGAELVKDIKLLASTSNIIRHHHEHVDGSGHPDGLVGGDIPLAARIVCLAEYLDELVIQGLAGEELQSQSAKMATEGAGTKFDKDVVDAYLSLAS